MHVLETYWSRFVEPTAPGTRRAIPSNREMSLLGRSRALAALLAVAFLVAGCADTVIDNVKVEEATKDSLEKSLHEKIKAVDCPSDQKVEAGNTFTCTVNFSDGKQSTATLEIRNKDADVSLVGLKSNE